MSSPSSPNQLDTQSHVQLISTEDQVTADPAVKGDGQAAEPDVGTKKELVDEGIGAGEVEKSEGDAVARDDLETEATAGNREAVETPGGTKLAEDVSTAAGDQQGGSTATSEEKNAEAIDTTREEQDVTDTSESAGIPGSAAEQHVGEQVQPMSAPASAPADSANAPEMLNQGSPSQSEMPTSSFVRVNSPAAGSSTSIFSSAPKKFSTVNINKKFLGKTSSSPVAGAPSPSVLGAKPAGLGSLIRPSISPNPSSTSTHKLTSAKLTSVISSKPGTGLLSSAPAVGWAKPTSRPSPGLSPSNDHPILNSPGLGAEVLRPTPSGLGSLKRGQLTTPSAGFGMGMGSKMKKEWAPVSAGEGYRAGLGRDFPTAGEVIEGQRQAQTQAQSIAQARAAHNAALIEGLDSFRGVNRDPKMHYWDEDDDENAVDDVIDFGDGVTYTIGSTANQPPSQVKDVGQIPQVPVSKEERFAEDFDRSWPPRGPPVMSGQNSRALYNDRSNRFEAHAEKAQNHLPPRPQQILSRATGFDRPPHGSDADSSRAPAMSREGTRPLPPHLAGRDSGLRDGERLFSNASGGLRSSQHDLPPHLRDSQSRPPQHQTSTASRPDRHFPPHLDHAADHESAPRPNRWATREKETSYVETSTPDSGRPRTQPLSAGMHSTGQEHANTSARVSPVLSPKATTSNLALADVEPQGAQVEPTVDQKDEMHEAAERARLRRQQEESEREARAERARQKAKQLEDKMKEAEALKAPTAQPPLTSPVISKILLRPVDSATVPTASAHVPSMASRPAESVNPAPSLGYSVPMDARRAEPSDLWRRPPQQPASSTGAADSSKPLSVHRPQAVLSRGIADSRQANQRGDASYPIRDRLPRAILPTDVLGQPAGESPVTVPVTVQFAELGSTDGLQSPAQPFTSGEPIREAEADGSRFAKKLYDAGTWRKPATTSASAHAGSARRTSVSQGGDEQSYSDRTYHQADPRAAESSPRQGETAAQTYDAATSTSEKPRRSSRPVESDNNFDQIMARIKSAIVAENSAATHARDLPADQVQEEKHLERSAIAVETELKKQRATSPGANAEPIARKAPVRYIPLPLPADFNLTTAPLPSDPPPAWKTFVTKLPKTRRASRPLPRKRTRSENMAPVPRGWALSWSPPFEQLNSNTLSRDEWLIPATYVRGRAVAPVTLPKRVFERYIAPAPVSRPSDTVSKQERPAAEEPSQTISTEEGKAPEGIARKIVVNLPRRAQANAGTRPIVNLPSPRVPRSRGVTQDYPAMIPVEAVQTTEDLDALLASPTPSETPLPIYQERNAARQTPNRRLPDGTGVVFARPHGGSFSEEAEAKSSMRFMVSSELEIDNLLEEVNNMSMDGLTETVPDASSLAARKQEEPVAHRNQNNDRSRATSPNTAASVAWAKSMAYPSAQTGQGLSNRDHIKNVWSQTGNNSLQHQSGNSLIGIADDLPPSLSVSIQDLKEESDKQAHHQNQLDTESPRFATVGAVTSESSDRLSYGQLQKTVTGDSGSTDTHPYGSFSQMHNGANYGYALSNDTPSPNLRHAGLLRSSFSGQNPAANVSNVSGLPGQHRGQHGVWVPLNQAGMASNAGMTAAMNGYMGMPVSPVYGTAAPTQKGNGRSSSHNGYLGNVQASGGMYSHPTGPLDSPQMSYMRPNLPTNNAYQTSGPQSAYPASSQSYSMRDGYANYGMSGNGMRQSGINQGGLGHSRYASMGSVRSSATGSNNHGQSGYNDQAARGLGMNGSYNSMNGMAGPGSVGSPRALGGSQAGGRMGGGGMSANGTVKRPW